MLFRYMILIFLALQLTACMLDNPDPYQRSIIPNTQKPAEPYLYPEGYDSVTNNRIPNTPTTVVVPETYHINSTHAPVSAKNVDNQWVSAQNPADYTIQLAADTQASAVATVLYNAPKTARSAEIKEGDKYIGLYGSYSSYDTAVQQLADLPEDIRSQAKVVQWGVFNSDRGRD